MNNQIVTRTLLYKVKHTKFNDTPSDLTIGILDSDVPTNIISYAKVLPDNYADYIKTGKGLPCIRFDQEEKALVGDVEEIASAKEPLSPIRSLFYEKLIGGDSGNPMFIIINNQPVILTVWTMGGGGDGTSITKFKNDINGRMRSLDYRARNADTYQLQEIDLSGFNSLP